MLRIFHTADWHLGHILHTVSRDYEHQQFLDWLLQQLQQQQADVLIVAGDIFDSANPPASAQARLYRFLMAAKQCLPTLTIILVGGNHDSASRLDAPQPVLEGLGIQVVGGLPRTAANTIAWQRLCIPLADRSGTVRAWCGAMPFLRHADLPAAAADNTDPLVDGVRSLYAELMAQLQEQAEAAHKLVLTGHCYMVGTQLSELSERKILGGNQHALPVDIFSDAVDYVALGHLHLNQQVGASRAHYSGSPIPLSFDEMVYRHQVLQIDLQHDTEPVITPLPVPRAVDLLRIPDRGYAPLADIVAALAEQVFDESLTQEQYPFLECRVLLDKPEPGLRQQLEAAVKNKPVRLLKITSYYAGSGQSLADIAAQERLQDLNEEQVFQRCYEQQHGDKAPPALLELFQQLLESVQETEA